MQYDGVRARLCRQARIQLLRVALICRVSMDMAALVRTGSLFLEKEAFVNYLRPFMSPNVTYALPSSASDGYFCSAGTCITHWMTVSFSSGAVEALLAELSVTAVMARIRAQRLPQQPSSAPPCLRPLLQPIVNEISSCVWSGARKWLQESCALECLRPCSERQSAILLERFEHA